MLGLFSSEYLYGPGRFTYMVEKLLAGLVRYGTVRHSKVRYGTVFHTLGIFLLWLRRFACSVQSPYLGSPVLTPEHQSTAEPQD
jgi:hypothetical protein